MIKIILAIFDLQVALIHPTSTESIGLSIQEKKFKQLFKLASIAVILDFQLEQFLATFDLQVTQVSINWLSVQEKKFKIDFQDCSHGSYLRFLSELF